MTHNEQRTHWFKEGVISFSIGVMYGSAVVAASHPLDTIKTKMQAQVGYESSGTLKTLIKVVKTDGVRGLYRGCIPPMWGSGIYRSLQFSGFEAAYTALDNDFGRTHIPLTNGVELRVVLSGISSATFRSIVETPLEYAKIRGQTGESWELRKCFTGLGITWARACVLMPTFFIAIDSFRRHQDDLFRSKVLGPFMVSGCSAVCGYIVCWPLDLIRTQVQGEYLKDKHMSILQRLKFVVKEHGFSGLYRGIVPGLIRSFIGNGVGMIIMQYSQKKVTQWGLRD